jgi:hypothetical protein
VRDYYVMFWPVWFLVMFFGARSEEVPMPKVDELVKGQMIAPFQLGQWLQILDVRRDPDDDYYRLVKVGHPDWEESRTARLGRDLEIEVR